MDERDAKRQGLEVHVRAMAFVRGYVTCTSCACNYNASVVTHREPTFCQIYSISIDPADTKGNALRAEACKQWVHEGMDRNNVVTPAHTYHYENWGD